MHNIASERIKKGLTQADLAKELGVSRNAVTRWESAKTVPSVGNLKKMSLIFGCSIDYLLDRTEERVLK